MLDREINPPDFYERDRDYREAMTECVICNDEISAHIPDSIVFTKEMKICSYCKKKIETNKNQRKYGI